MDVHDAYDQGLEKLTALWGEVHEKDAETSLPDDIHSAIATVMSPSSLKSQRFALPTQVLLKMVVGDPDGRRMDKFDGVNGAFSARSFARETVAALKPLNERLGYSEDPYVSNPLRKDRLQAEYFTGRGKDAWHALFRVLDYVDENPEQAEAVMLRVLAEVKDREPSSKAEALSPTPQAQDLPSLVAQTGLTQDRLLDIIDVLQSGQPQVIFAGPPGTSKTYVAVALAQYLTEGNEDNYTVVQLHASYGYEEFVEGLRPVKAENGFDFDVYPGVIRRITADWQEGDSKVLIVDEMNRANLPRVLGELLYAIERRRSPVDLMYTQNFSLPPGLAIIGTMNTADRSIRSIDAAVRRRFQIFDFPPDGQLLESFYADRSNEVVGLREGLEMLNTELTQLIDRHHTIGHTFLMDPDGMTPDRLRQIWSRQMLPLIEEYLFDQPDILGEFLIERFWPAVIGE